MFVPPKISMLIILIIRPEDIQSFSFSSVIATNTNKASIINAPAIINVLTTETFLPGPVVH